ncbi:MAG: type II toxin-antitoxin system VapC family toxin [Flexistipes sinusarabici]|uniref:Type II toxin-antitoxin system VapC family toxin n=1 Tax=Flexistipes sinusarabici TaxID=2352 RepID=A0A5D0MM45_FLESI|nr:type II toxin-antitoxin system VapC family toxin [Flexistipes sinusarabici]TYB33025.1 MAG: type II toxin-antitoxin system VapC family toxin [Flexistipes sinusarabici]
MGNRAVLIDTSILINYFRKKDKENTFLYKLFEKDFDLVVSVITLFEYKLGSKDEKFDDFIFNNIKIIDFDKSQGLLASRLYKELKKENKVIEFRDFFIASCSIFLSIPLLTLNKNHFERIKKIEMFDERLLN